MTRVSICVPTYNGEPFIQDALQSIVRQTWDDYELIVCDDCSTDGTRRVVEAIHDPRLRLVVNERRLGLVGNWNRCVELASGEYIYIFHQDDLMEPDNAARKVAVLDRHPGMGFVFSNMKSIDATGAMLGEHWATSLPLVDTVYSGKEFFRHLLMKGNLVPCSSVLVRRSCYLEHGLFDERLHYTPDLEMWLRLSLHEDVAYLAGPLISFRRHASQESDRFAGRAEEVREVWRAFQIVLGEQRSVVPEPETAYRLALGHLKSWSLMFTRQALRQGQPARAVAFARMYLELAAAGRQRSRLGA